MLGLGRSRRRKPPPISVIIPTYNECSCIGTTVKNVLALADTSRPPEIVIVDGGSSDNTTSFARNAGASRVLVVSGGRAAQLNAGARIAASDTLFFLHADSTPPRGFPRHVAHALRAHKRVVAGAFRLRIDSNVFGVRIIERIANWRARWMQLPYGDQGLFITKKKFEEVHGYPLMPFMDDYAMSRKLARVGRINIATQSVTTSARRWEALGVVPTTIINQLIIFGYQLGVPLPRLERMYRGVLKWAVELKEPQQGKDRRSEARRHSRRDGRAQEVYTAKLRA